MADCDGVTGRDGCCDGLEIGGNSSLPMDSDTLRDGCDGKFSLLIAVVLLLLIFSKFKFSD